MNNYKFNEFINIARKLNDLDIIPMLMGSVGLEVVTGKSWESQDLDIHVPGDKGDGKYHLNCLFLNGMK